LITALLLENFLGFGTRTRIEFPPGPLAEPELGWARAALALLAAVPGDLEAAVKAGVGGGQLPYGWAAPGSHKAVVALEAEVEGADGLRLHYGLRFSLVFGNFSVTDELIEDRTANRPLYWYENGTRRQLLWTPEALRELPHDQRNNRRSVLAWREVLELSPPLAGLAKALNSAEL
jgi:hypothetical protein